MAGAIDAHPPSLPIEIRLENATDPPETGIGES